MRQLSRVAWVVSLLLVPTGGPAYGQEPPAVNPFGPREQKRADAVPGYVELSDGSVHPGQIYLTRDARLKILDAEQQRTRDVPLSAVRRIDCQVKREWMEKEWRFKENANDEKVYTGRSYPSREYTHKITLQDGRTIQGSISAIVYVQRDDSVAATSGQNAEPQRFLLHERDKGPVGSDLKSLISVRVIELGEKALEEGQQRAKARAESAKDDARKKKDKQ